MTILSPTAVKAEEIHRGWATAYTLKGITSTGIDLSDPKSQELNIVASKPEWYGATMFVWDDPGDHLIHPENFIGMYTVADSGSEKIRNGSVIDIWLPTYEECKQFGGRKVIYQVVKGEG